MAVLWIYLCWLAWLFLCCCAVDEDGKRRPDQPKPEEPPPPDWDPADIVARRRAYRGPRDPLPYAWRYRARD